MRLLDRVRAVLVAAGLLAALGATPACSSESDVAASSDESAIFSGVADDDVGQLFMIEHFGVPAQGFSDVLDMIKRKNLGSIILWNPEQVSGEVARRMATTYSAAAQAAHRPELFYAADQEERGTQRFRAQHGFTDLVDGATLGRVVAREGNPRVCELHARITAREMASAGLNMALGTVSDIFTRTSGTPGMFRSRAIGSDPRVVASCIEAMTKGYAAEQHVVFITKHFPGLGNASGNTDVDASVHTLSSTKDAIEAELSPYRGATAAVNADDSWPIFGAMVSHASYEVLDGTGSPGTLSRTILTDLLRGDPSQELELGGVDKQRQRVSFKGLGLKGLTVSDAFWTWGAMRNLTPVEKRRMMARSVLAGMDILMIAKADFSGAWDYFQALLASQLPAAEQAELVAATHEADFAAVLAKFRARVRESAGRIRAAKSRVGLSTSFAGQGEPRAASAELADEYRRLTR